MTAARLREAAARLREVAEVATPGPWSRFGYDVERHMQDLTLAVASAGEHCADAAYIATMHPPVAMMASKLLDTIADLGCFPPDPHEPGEGCHDCDTERAALTVADAILGEAS